MDCSPPGSSVHGISQKKILKQFAISSSNSVVLMHLNLQKWKWKCFAQSFLTLCGPMDSSPPGSSVHGNSPGKNTGVDFHFLLQGIFPTQGLNPGLLHCRQILYCLSHQVIWWTLSFSKPFEHKLNKNENISFLSGTTRSLGQIPGNIIPGHKIHWFIILISRTWLSSAEAIQIYAPSNLWVTVSPHVSQHLMLLNLIGIERWKMVSQGSF